MERKILRVKQLLENKYRNCKKINIKALEDKIQKTHKIKQKGRQEIGVERKLDEQIKRQLDNGGMERVHMYWESGGEESQIVLLQSGKPVDNA